MISIIMQYLYAHDLCFHNGVVNACDYRIVCLFLEMPFIIKLFLFIFALALFLLLDQKNCTLFK